MTSPSPARCLRILRAALEHDPSEELADALDTVDTALMALGHAATAAAPNLGRYTHARDQRGADGRTTSDVLEDVAFLVDNGSGWREIVARIGRTETALERLLERHKQQHLTARAKNRDRERVSL